MVKTERQLMFSVKDEVLTTPVVSVSKLRNIYNHGTGKTGEIGTGMLKYNGVLKGRSKMGNSMNSLTKIEE